MADIYNTTTLSQTTDFYSYATEVNTLSEGWLAIMILFAFFFIIWIVFRQYDSKSVFLTASFLTFFVGLLMFFASWINIGALLVLIVLLAVSIIAQVWRSN